MVHTERSVDLDVSQSKSLNDLDVSQLVPSSLFLNQNRIFQACEYNINGHEMELDHAFASQLRNFLVEYQLKKVIVLIPSVAADGGLHDSIEFTHHDENGTIRSSRQRADVANIGTTDPIITQWSFFENEQGVVECKGNNVCSPQKTGKHRVFSDSKAHHRGM
ncbi:hypothetical protein MMC18_005781 [Xylographa bjoerkii]|nr:hypothetical protein [Xylographa bjoerkii]